MANESRGAAFLDNRGPDGKMRSFDLAKVEDAKKVVGALLSAVVEGDQTREEWLWKKFMNHTDPRISFESFRLMLNYKYGKPKETKELTVEDNRVAEIPPQTETSEEWEARYKDSEKRVEPLGTLKADA